VLYHREILGAESNKLICVTVPNTFSIKRLSLKYRGYSTGKQLMILAPEFVPILTPKFVRRRLLNSLDLIALYACKLLARTGGNSIRKL